VSETATPPEFSVEGDQGDSDYRQPAKAHSPAMASLAGRADDRRRELPREAGQLGPRELNRRLVAAIIGETIAEIAIWTVLIIVFCFGAGLFIGGIADGSLTMVLGSLPLVLAPVAAAIARLRTTRRAVAAELAWPARLPFPVEGYDLWLASARPILDVALRTPVERRLLFEGIAGFDPAIAVSHLDDRTVRLEVPARPGDYPAAAFHALVAEVLVPLHQDVGIDGVSMGGALR
jgi:hypothetical protein